MIYYSHKTALKFWLQDETLPFPGNYKGARQPGSSYATPPLALIASCCPVPIAPEESIDILVAQSARRKNIGVLKLHSSTHKFPPRSFLQVGEEVAVASPEMAFVQSARELSLREMLFLGYRMCSTFRIVDEFCDIRGFADCMALTSKKSLHSYIQKAKDFSGAKICRRALKYLCDGQAASPRELILAMLLTMPTLEGGYNIKAPELNARISLNTDQQRVAGKTFLTADMLWRKERVTIEYGSDQWHSGPEKLMADSRRRNMLKALGYEVITITNQEIKHLRFLDVAIEGLCKALGIRKRVSVAGYEAKKRVLHAWLLKQFAGEPAE